MPRAHCVGAQAFAGYFIAYLPNAPGRVHFHIQTLRRARHTGFLPGNNHVCRLALAVRIPSLFCYPYQLSWPSS